MTPLDALWHLTNLFAVAALTGVLAASATKLLWRRELTALRWRQLAGPAVTACAATTLAGLVLFGQDGRLLTYGAMAGACALTLWWRGFGRRR